MPSWMPDWQAMRAAAPEIAVSAGEGYVYFIADAHLGDARAAPEPFLEMLRRLPEARMVVFLGDLFKVWLALPKYWNAPVRAVLEGFRGLRAGGTPVVFVVGNREFLLPRDPAVAARLGLPFDHIVHGMCVLRWRGRRYGLTHGDLVNRHDRQYLRWRRISRGPALEALFRAIPGGAARRLAQGLEFSLARTNREIKVRYPRAELEAFSAAMATGLDGFLIGHFHRDEVVPAGDRAAFLRIVPDWFSRKVVLRMEPGGGLSFLAFAESAPGARSGD